MNTALSAVLALACLSVTSAQTLRCYECDDSIDDQNDNANTRSCASLEDNTLSTAKYWACSTKYGTTAVGTSTITRTGLTTANKTYECAGDTCYCNTDSCNNQVVTTPRQLNCYHCQSADYFNNGCGETLDTTSKYVQTIMGCFACGKTVTFTGYRYHYARGCVRSVNVNDVCHTSGDGTTSTKSCSCTGALCNSATKGLPLATTSIISTLLLALYSTAC